MKMRVKHLILLFVVFVLTCVRAWEDYKYRWPKEPGVLPKKQITWQKQTAIWQKGPTVESKEPVVSQKRPDAWQKESAEWQKGSRVWQKEPKKSAVRQKESVEWHKGSKVWQKEPAVWKNEPAVRPKESAVWQKEPAVWKNGPAVRPKESAVWQKERDEWPKKPTVWQKGSAKWSKGPAVWERESMVWPKKTAEWQKESAVLQKRPPGLLWKKAVVYPKESAVWQKESAVWQKEPSVCQERHPIAKCTFLSSDVQGVLILIQKHPDDPLLIEGEISGLSPGLHGMHVHESGDISNECESTGGHFNPHGKEHGAPSDSIRHLGDLGNIKANKKGVAHVNKSDDLLKLGGPLSIMGRSIVIHAGRDDLGRGGNENSKMSGNSGPRIGCCEITDNNSPFVEK